jgi:hypothetical protein
MLVNGDGLEPYEYAESFRSNTWELELQLSCVVLQLAAMVNVICLDDRTGDVIEASLLVDDLPVIVLVLDAVSRHYRALVPKLRTHDGPFVVLPATLLAELQAPLLKTSTTMVRPPTLCYYLPPDPS